MNLRALVRAGFLAVFVLSCWQLWRYYQWALGASPTPVAHPEATAGFVPLGALMSLFAWLRSGAFDPVMPASVVIVLGALVLSLFLKRAFCGFVCPVGTVLSAVGWAGRRLNGGRRRKVNRKLDIALRVPKYLFAGIVVASMAVLPVQVALEFQRLPYYATADMKILYGLLHPAWGYLVLVGFVVATTLAIGTDTWCRYLCPLGALYGGLSSASLCTVKRDAEKCIDCKACDLACSARVEVSTSTRAVRDPECDGCQDCTRACPQPGALSARVGGFNVPWQLWPALVLAVWLLVWATASATGHWQQGLDDATIAGHMRTMKLTHDFQSSP
jgi:polyferredoxin